MNGVSELLCRIRHGRYTLKQRILLYFSTLSAVLLVCLMVLLFCFDFVSSPKKNIEKSLESYLITYERSVAGQMGDTAAHGISLAASLTAMIERALEAENIPFSAMTDNGRLISKLENQAVFWLKNALLQSRSSGSFVIFDATVNSAVSSARQTRCGVYLKIGNLAVSTPVSPELFCLRGLPELAAKHRFGVHNKWDLEFDLSQIPFYSSLLAAAASDASEEGYFLSQSFFLRGTWDKIMLLCVPLKGKDGTVYGVCGLEINAILYRLAHKVPCQDFPGMTGLLALKSSSNGENLLHIGTGLESEVSLGRFAVPASLSITDMGHYNRYQNDDMDFAGRERTLQLAPLSLPGQEGTWVVSVMLPWETVQAFSLRYYAVILCFFVLLLCVAFGISLLLAHRYATPVLQGVQKVREGGGTSVNVREIDELIEFLKAKEQELLHLQENMLYVVDEKGKQALHADITEYRTFMNQISTLSRAERQVFELYVKGKTSQEVSLILNLSINTIRTHNRNIYSKLNVSSYKELMVYIRMMTSQEKSSIS